MNRFGGNQDGGSSRLFSEDTISLPPPQRTGGLSVEEALFNRRSRRTYGDRPLERTELGQLLWAAQGVTDRRGAYRTAPSAGALYPLELSVTIGADAVESLGAGVYRYSPVGHELERVQSGDVRKQLRTAALDQDIVELAPISIIVCAVDERTTQKYGQRGASRYVPMEAGHAGQNIYLQAESLGLSTVSVGAFDDERVRDILGAPPTRRPLYIFPVGPRV
ncbi:MULTISPECIES: SagB/ThcOx family dehydrogenase [Haloferax]|uniref:SagB/ThcOx family dehydrogenase n=1 Tax=Haloferax marinum TaxID=2666143 RepID=A0A6A8GB76_9EURY|nr:MULTISPECIES: SagB/ThcOx family dehydrogenase [Haloferax]KAB1190725.1 SagB/ThcOx family dehydrogenase [Haloferax sp. CBA1150]MRW98261.1 SagB/ThcOx family dehydrogenase [Haloferax marinum]